MRFELDRHDAYTVIGPKGRLNMVAAPELRAVVNEALAAGSRRLVVDLAETDFMDSSGLGALVSSLKSARQAGGDLRIANAGEQILLILRLTRLDRILTVFTSVEDAYREA